MQQTTKDLFIDEFNAMVKSYKGGHSPETALFSLGSEFRNRTGGRLSHYNNPIPVGVAIVRVIKDGVSGFLGCRRAIAPFIGGIAFPGGFVNEGETTKEAAIRELVEETGLMLSSNWKHVDELLTPANQLLTFYLADETVTWEEADAAFTKMNDVSETSEIYFVKDTILCFSLHQQVLDSFK